MKKHFFISAIIIFISIPVGLLIIPGKHELPLLYFKDNDYKIARQLYEEMMTEKDYSISVLSPLLDIYIKYGDLKQAVEIMEHFVQKNPDNIDARYKLGTLFQYSQRPYDYLLNLEILNRLDPSDSNLRELSKIYNFTAQFNKQITVLKKIIKLEKKDTKDFIDLAHLQASQKLIKEATETLELLEKYNPDVFKNGEILDFLISLLVDSGSPEQAFQKASSWLTLNHDPNIAARLAGILHFKGELSYALKLLYPFITDTTNNIELLSELTQLLILNNRQEEAFSRLNTLYKAQILPTPLYEAFIGIALERKEYNIALKAAKRTDMTTLPSWLLFNLAEAAEKTNRHNYITDMVEEVGDDFMKKNPVIATEFFMKAGNKKKASHWIGIAKKKPDLTEKQQIKLVNIYIKLKQKKNAEKIIKNLLTLKSIPDSSIADLTSIFIEMKMESKGFDFFEKLRSTQQSPEIEAGWGILGASSGKEEKITQWLDCNNKKTFNNNLITDIYFIANDSKKKPLVLKSSECLYKRKKNKTNLTRYVNALIDSNQPVSALKIFKNFPPAKKDNNENYSRALYAAFSLGEPVTEDLRRFIKRKLSKPTLSEKEKEELIYTLINIKAYEIVLPILANLAKNEKKQWIHTYKDITEKSNKEYDLISFLKKELEREDLTFKTKEERLYMLIEQSGETNALPYIKKFAYEFNGDWADFYENTLIKMNRNAELKEFWKKEMLRTDIPQERKRMIAYRMLDKGMRKTAERSFYKLSEDAPPDNSNVSQLLFMWGPRPPSYGIKWLISRAKSSRGKEKAAWMNHLSSKGEAKEAINLIKDNLPLPGQNKILIDAYINALLISHNGKSLKKIIEREIKTEKNPERLRKFSSIALQENQQEVTIKAYQKLLYLLPDDKETLGKLGYFSYINGNYSQAEKYLSNYLTSGEGNYETNFFYGEILSKHKKDNPSAKFYYERALKQIRTLSDNSLSIKLLKAKLLYRAGQQNKSLTTFESLMNSYPENKDLKADFAEILLELGKYQKAQEILY